MFKNTFKTFTLLAGLAGLAIAVGGLLGGSTGLLIGLLFGLGIVGFSYWQSDKLALRAARARVVTAAEAPELHRMVAGLAERAGLPMPTVAISPNPQPNAFATGRNPEHAVVCVTDGLWQSLPPAEVEGVLAHELMHVRHRDILIGSVAAAIATGISFLAQMAMFSAIFGGRNDREGGNPIGALALAVLAPMAAGLMQMAVSRSREFEADRGAAELLGTGEPLAQALQRIEVLAKQRPMQVNPSQAYAWIHNPLSEGGRRRGGGPDLARLFSTHPATEERIRRLRAMSPTAGQLPPPSVGLAR
jgi:heat shock protein HtpX